MHMFAYSYLKTMIQFCGWLRAAVVASAFVSQMDDESKNLVAAKTALETALAAGNPLSDVRQALELANEKYKTASVQIRKHAQPPKPKGKAKASAPTPPAWKVQDFCLARPTEYWKKKMLCTVVVVNITFYKFHFESNR